VALNRKFFHLLELHRRPWIQYHARPSHS
jgi:hypothetical protein